MGEGYSKVAVISSIALAVIILFYPLIVGSYLQLDVYRFEDRTTFHQYLKDRYIFDELTDNLIICLSLLIWFYFSLRNNKLKRLVVLFLGTFIAISLPISGSSAVQIISLVSFPLILTIYFTSRKFDNGLLLRDSSVLTTNYYLLLFLVLVITSAFFTVSKSDGRDPFINIMTLLSRFAPAIMFLIFFSALIRIIVDRVEVLPIQRWGLSSIVNTFGTQKYQIIRHKKTILLSSFMALSILIVLIPHLDGRMNRVGEDTILYSKWVQGLKGLQNPEQILAFLFAGNSDRPLTLIIMYGILTLVNNNVVMAFEIILPALLAPLLVLCIYYLTYEISKSSLDALCSSFVTAVSFQIMIGVYAGLYANWIALIVGYFSLWLAVRILNTYSKKYMVGFTILMTILLLSHSYTWTIITAFLIVFLIVLRLKKMFGTKQIRAVLIIVVCLIVFDILRSTLPGSYSAIQRDVVIAESIDEDLQQLSARWSVLVRTVEVFLGGIFGNIVVLLLVFHFAVMYRFKNLAGYFSMTFLSLGVIPLFFGDKIFQSRILYDIPFQIPAGLALANIFISRNGNLKTIVIGASLLAISVYTMNNLGISPR